MPSHRIDTLIANLSQDFSLDTLSKSPARFNLEKLNWFNRQYIQMLNLDEFATRASHIQLRKRYPDHNLRVGDYVWLVDFDKQKVFLNESKSSSGQDGGFYPLGGGREPGLSSIENLHKEIQEEAEGRLTIDESKLLFLTTFQFLSPSPYVRENQEYTGKEFNLYVYAMAEENLEPFVEVETGEEWPFDWHDLATVLASNQFVTYPIWKEFCLKNQLPCLEPSTQIAQQYLAWYLDKNRITTLNELGMDSNCILEYQQPSQEEIKWKKISIEESLHNLATISPIINDLLQSHDQRKQEILTIVLELIHPNLQDSATKRHLNQRFEEQFQSLVQSFESEVKSYLQTNQLDIGSYLWPLRVALSGKVKSPSPFELIAVLSSDEVTKRIRSQLAS